MPTTDTDKTRWSTRYYRLDCDRVTTLMKTHGLDDRDDPPTGTRLPCIAEGHGEHALVRVSPDEFERLDADDEDDE